MAKARPRNYKGSCLQRWITTSSMNDDFNDREMSLRRIGRFVEKFKQVNLIIGPAKIPLGILVA